MSNSKLVKHTNISPHRNSPRNHEIDTVTIHVVEGQVTAERLGETFANPDRNGSANYGVDKDGRVGMYVEEKDRAWTSNSAANDHRAITIEVASDTTPPYWVNEKAMAGLIDLLVDICERNNIPKLLWKNDPNLIGQVDKQNMTVHRWFASTSCPGEYMMGQMGEIAKKVNARLGAEEEKEEEKKEEEKKPTNKFKAGDKVVISSGAVYTNGVAVPSSCIEVQYTVQEALTDRCLLAEITSWVANKYLTLSGQKKEEPKKEVAVSKPAAKPTATVNSAKVKKGDLVSIASGAVYTNGVSVPYSIRTSKWYVSSVNGNVALIDKNEKGNRSIGSTINVKYLTVVGASANPKPTKVASTAIKVGDKVKIKANARYSNGVRVPSAYINKPYTVSQISKDNKKALIKELNSWVSLTYLTK